MYFFFFFFCDTNTTSSYQSSNRDKRWISIASYNKFRAVLSPVFEMPNDPIERDPVFHLREFVKSFFHNQISKSSELSHTPESSLTLYSQKYHGCQKKKHCLNYSAIISGMIAIRKATQFLFMKAVLEIAQLFSSHKKRSSTFKWFSWQTVWPMPKTIETRLLFVLESWKVGFLPYARLWLNCVRKLIDERAIWKLAQYLECYTCKSWASSKSLLNLINLVWMLQMGDLLFCNAPKLQGLVEDFTCVSLAEGLRPRQISFHALFNFLHRLLPKSSPLFPDLSIVRCAISVMIDFLTYFDRTWKCYWVPTRIFSVAGSEIVLQK